MCGYVVPGYTVILVNLWLAGWPFACCLCLTITAIQCAVSYSLGVERASGLLFRSRIVEILKEL